MRKQILPGFTIANVDYVGSEIGPFNDRIIAEAKTAKGTIGIVGGVHGDFGGFSDLAIFSGRPDLPWQDVPFLLSSVATGAGSLGLRATDRQWERNLRIVLDGLRTPDPSPLPGAAPEIRAG